MNFHSPFAFTVTRHCHPTRRPVGAVALDNIGLI